MILISHRGNINGKNENLENKPEYVDDALLLGFDVEIDVWYIDDTLYLGHDEPQYKVSLSWIRERSQKIWVHCKNLECVSFLKNYEDEINFFWHERDSITLTSKKYIWVYPGNQPVKNSICVLPEQKNDTFSCCLGICSDFIKNYL